jgi:hypothetical protein
MIGINVERFVLANVLDTCAIWNILSSLRLYRGALVAGCAFCGTDYVLYECLHKPRSRARPGDSELRTRLVRAQARGEIVTVFLSVEDLQELEILGARKRLGRGELSALAFARRSRVAFLTDDQGARRLANETLQSGYTQTTPHLLAWLLFTGHLTDGDKLDVLREHQDLGGNLAPHLEVAYCEAMRCKLMTRQKLENPTE